MTQDKNPFDDMIDRGELIPPTGPIGQEAKDPLRELSCEETLNLLPYFCEGRFGGDDLKLAKVEKHLKDSVSRKCGCAEKFSKLNEIKD